MGPYRAVTGTETLEAPTRVGMAKLHVAPRHVELEVGTQRMSVTEDYVTVVDTQKQKKRKKPKPRSMKLDGARLIMARAVPTEDIGLWYEPKPGNVMRIFGLPPVELLDNEALVAWSALDRLAQRLKGAIAPHAAGVLRATEIGHGLDRVLVTDDGETLLYHVRKLFRPVSRVALEVHADGEVTIYNKRGSQTFRVSSRHQVTVIGDLVRFAKPDGEDIGAVAIPWVSPEERRTLAGMAATRVDQTVPTG